MMCARACVLEEVPYSKLHCIIEFLKYDLIKTAHSNMIVKNTPNGKFNKNMVY